MARLAHKTGTRSTRGRLREWLRVSKIDIPPKNDVPLSRVPIQKLVIFTMGELTSAKIGDNVAGDDKIEEKTGKLTIHTVGGIDTSDVVTTAVDDSVTEGVLWSLVEEVAYKSVDEVLDTSIKDIWSWEVARGD